VKISQAPNNFPITLSNSCSDYAAISRIAYRLIDHAGIEDTQSNPGIILVHLQIDLRRLGARYWGDGSPPNIIYTKVLNIEVAADQDATNTKTPGC